MDRLAEAQEEMAAQAFYGQLGEAPAMRTLTEAQLRDASIRTRGEHRSLPRHLERAWIGAMAGLLRSESRREASEQELSDRPPALAPPDPRRLPMWVEGG